MTCQEIQAPAGVAAFRLGLQVQYHKTSPGIEEAGHRLRWVREWFDFQKVYPIFKAMIWENHATRVIQDGGEALELYRRRVQDPYWISETYTGE